MRRLYCIVPIVLLASVECASIAKKAFNQPKVTIENIRVKDVSFAGVTLVVDVGVENPNSVGLTVSGLKYKVLIDGSPLVEGERPEKTAVEANKKNVFTFPVMVYYSGLRSGVAGVLTRSRLPYRFEGKVTLDTPLGDLTFNLDRDGEIPIPRRPRFEVEQVTVEEMSLASATITFHVLVTNNEDVALDLKRFQYRINIHGQDVSAAEMSIERTLGLGKSMRLGIPVNLKFLGLRQGFIETIKSGKFNYIMQFNLQLDSAYGPYELPYEKEALVSLY